MSIGKSIGLDLGSKTCGVAISDGLGMFAHPIDTLYYDTDMAQLEAPLRKIINDVGLRAQISEEFKTLLDSWFDCEVVLVDERLTTAAATKQLISQDVSRKKRKKVVDQLAAVHILQSHLDRQRFLRGD